MSGTCPTCGLPTIDVEDALLGARYDDTQGGHNDRHTLVLEAADRVVVLGDSDGAA